MSKGFLIEKNISIPPVRKGTVQKLLAQMVLGDSIGGLSGKQAGSIQSTAYRHGYKVVRRKENANTYRIWVVEVPPAREQ